MATVGILVSIGWAVLVVVAVIAVWRRHQRAILEWRNWATARNWLFFDDWPELVDRFSGGPFGKGSDRKAQLGYEGTYNSLPCIGFRYKWTEGSGDDSTTYHRSIYAVRIEGARLPDLALRREVWGNGRDLQFENAEFNRQWHVTSNVPRFAHDVIHPRMMELLMANQVAFDRLWFEQDHILLSGTRDHNTAIVDVHLDFLTRVVGLIPPFVFPEVGARRPQLTNDGPGVPYAEQQRRIAYLQQQHTK